MSITTERGKFCYETIIEEASKPIKFRDACLKTNRGNLRKPRKYHMTEVKLKELIEENQKENRLPNPFRWGGLYWGFIEALISLGENKKHSFADVKNKMKEALEKIPSKKETNKWEEFSLKLPKDSGMAKDLNGRIFQNAEMLQRLTGLDPYGYRLLQVGMCIDIFKGTYDIPDFLLRNGYNIEKHGMPINEFKRVPKKNGL
jgi:hypothetical protein